MSLMEKFSDRKFVFASCAFIYLVNVSGILLLSFGEPCFNLLYWFLTVPTTLLIVLVYPTIGFARQLRGRLGFGWQGAIFLGLGLSVAFVPLVVFWSARIVGFYPATMGAILLFSSGLMMLTGDRKCDSPLHNYEIPLQTVKEKVIFYFSTLFFMFLVLLAFIYTGTLSWRGVAIPAIGDWVYIYGDISAIVATGIPPQNPFITSGELSYYYFFHLYSAIYVLISGGGISIQNAGALCVMVCVAAVSCSFFCVSRIWLKSFAGALLSVLLITCIGGWDIIGIAIVKLQSNNAWDAFGSYRSWPPDIDFWTDWTVFKIHSPITGFHYLPQHLAGILCFWLFFFFLSVRGKKKWFFCFASLAGGLGYSSWAIIGAAPTVSVFLVLELLSRDALLTWRKWIRRWVAKVMRIAVVVAFAVMATLPIYLKAFGGSYGSGSPIRYWRLPPLNAVAWLPSTYKAPNLFSHVLGLLMIEIGEFGPLLLLGIPGLFLCLRLKDRQARNMLVAVFCVNFFLINSLNAGGTNPGECVSKVDAYFVWWALAVFAGLFVRERYHLKGNALSIARNYTRRWLNFLFNGIVICGLALGLSSSLYSVAGKTNTDYLPEEDYIAFAYMREKIPVTARVQRSPHYPLWTIPAWGWRLTAFSAPPPAWEYLVPVDYVWAVQRDIEKAFQTTDAREAHRLLSRYNVDYILLGSYEKERYGEKALRKFHRAPGLFEPQWTHGEIEILKLIH